MKNNSLRVALLLVVALSALHSASSQTKLNAAGFSSAKSRNGMIRRSRKLQNKSGTFVAATPESGTVTLNTTQFPSDNLRAWPSDPDGQDAYPIATFSWFLLYKKYDSKEVWDALKKFVAYGLSDGQKFADELGYIALPK